jgi:hypothetical protein
MDAALMIRTAPEEFVDARDTKNAIVSIKGVIFFAFSNFISYCSKVGGCESVGGFR